MKGERQFIDSQVDGFPVDDHSKFEEDDSFLSIPPTDESGDSDDEHFDENGADLILSFRRPDDEEIKTTNRAFAYLQEIAKTPLLTRDEEIELFQQFEADRQRVTELLNQLPPVILEGVRDKSKPARNVPDNRELWWNPMAIATILEQIQKEIRAYHLRQTIEHTASSRRTAEKKRLKALWKALTRHVQKMLAVKSKIVRANLLLVASVAKGHHFPTSQIEFLDFMQEGSIGLMKAVDKFDVKRGYRFSTYATWWIMQTIKRAIDEKTRTIRIPAYITETRSAIEAAVTCLTNELERHPDIEEIAQAIDLPEERVVETLKSARNPISLFSPLSEFDPDTTISDLLTDESQVLPEEACISRSEGETLEKVLGTLTPREATVIKLRYGLVDDHEHTLAEIGTKLGISRERVRQIQEDALGKLRHPARAQYLRELL